MCPVLQVSAEISRGILWDPILRAVAADVSSYNKVYFAAYLLGNRWPGPELLERLNNSHRLRVATNWG